MRRTRQTANGKEEEMTGSAKTSEARGAHSELSKGDGEGEKTMEKTIGSAKTSETRGAHSELNRGEDREAQLH
jgi:hypothetical protein